MRSTVLRGALAIAVLLFGACGSDDDPQATTSPDATSVSTSSPPETDAAATPEPSSVFFRSPSGNIACGIFTQDSVRCDVSEATFEPPAKPTDCDLDWGTAVTVSAPGRGEFACVGDTVADPNAEVLAYGQEMKLGGFACESAESGMTCRNESTGHGFTVSRSKYRLF